MVFVMSHDGFCGLQSGDADSALLPIRLQSRQRGGDEEGYQHPGSQVSHGHKDTNLSTSLYITLSCL